MARGKPRLNLLGQRYGRWTVIRDGGKDEKQHTTWWCRCDCGKEKRLRTSFLRKGETKSCGCYAADVQRARMAQYAYPTRTGAASYMVEKDGKTQSLKEWSKELGILLSVLIIRWNRGWSDDEILKPVTARIRKQYEWPDPQWDIEDRQKDEETT